MSCSVIGNVRTVMLQGTALVFSAPSDECVPEAVSQLAGYVVTKLAFWGGSSVVFFFEVWRKRSITFFRRGALFQFFSARSWVSGPSSVRISVAEKELTEEEKIKT